MTGQESGKTAVCSRFARNIYHFQAGELPADERQELAAHVEDCPHCTRRLEIEDTFLRGLRGRMPRASAPPGLRYRVRAALDSQPARPRGAGWLRASWLVPAAAALLLAAVLLPTMPRWASIVHVEREVTVVDFDCASAGRSLQEQRLCTHPYHLNALAVGSDEYWNISLHPEAGRRLVADRDLRGHRVHVVGDLYTGIQTLHVANFTDRDSDRGLTAHLDFGPADANPRLIPRP